MHENCSAHDQHVTIIEARIHLTISQIMEKIMEVQTNYKSLLSIWLCYVVVPDHLRTKFDKKAILCIFVGVGWWKKRVKVLWPHN